MPRSPDVGFLLDTNVISEVSRSQPDPRAMAWLAETDEDRMFLSVATLAEISHGIEALDPGKRQRRLRSWLLDDLVLRFDSRILAVDAAVGLLWGNVVARSETAGRPIEAMDALIAATAERFGLTLVTRNVSDFKALSLPMLNPWGPATS